MILNVTLVGSNPLPCYVPIAYLRRKQSSTDKESRYLPRPDQILLVTTKDTNKYFAYIEHVLRKNELLGEQEKLESLQLDGSGRDASSIEKALIGKIKEIMPKEENNHIVLNNTGGTKVMATYATLGIRSTGIPVTECYMDADENRLRCHVSGEDVDQMFPEEGDLRDYVQMDISQLAWLHAGVDVNFKFQNGTEEDFCNKCIKCSAYSADVWRKTGSRVLGSHKSYKVFFNKFFKKNANAISEKIQGFLMEHNEVKDLFRDNWNNFKLLEEFDSGFWYEKYLYWALLEAKKRLWDDNKICIKTAWSCEVPISQQKKFEVDVLALRGYQLTVFSVSLADYQGLAKGKWFEAVYRTEQMAGGHGKTVIVSFLDKKEEKKLNGDLETFDRKPVVYTREMTQNFEGLVDNLVDLLR